MNMIKNCKRSKQRAIKRRLDSLISDVVTIDNFDVDGNDDQPMPNAVPYEPPPSDIPLSDANGKETVICNVYNDSHSNFKKSDEHCMCSYGQISNILYRASTTCIQTI